MSEINRWSTSAGGALQNASGYFPEGQAPSTVNDAARTIMAELKRQHQAENAQKTATYAAQGYSVTFDREVTAGERAGIWTFIADTANHSGSATLNINALGAKDFRKPSGHMETSDIDAKQVCVVAYNPTGDYYELLSRVKRESKFKTGTYTGDGSTSMAITGVGFTPKFLLIWLAGTDGGTMAAIIFTSDTFMALDAQGLVVFMNQGSGDFNVADNRVIALGSDGFTVSDDGTDLHPNKASQGYHYVAWG